MRHVDSLDDVQSILQDHENQLRMLSNASINFNGRRITGAGDAKDLQDYVTLSQVNSLIASIAPGAVSSATENNLSIGTASGTLTCTTSFQDIAGCAVVLDRKGVYLIIGIVDGNVASTSGALLAELDIFYSAVDHSQIGNILISALTGTANAVTAAQVWKYNNSTSVIPVVAKLRAKETVNAGTTQAIITNSQIIALFVG